MNTNSKILLVLSLLAGLAACGGDDSNSKTVDAGPIVKPVDGGTVVGMNDAGSTSPDSSTPVTTNDAGVTPPTGDCFTGTPVQMVDFLNRCTTAQTTTKTVTLPAGDIGIDGGLSPL